MSAPIVADAPAPQAAVPRSSRRSSLLAHGEPSIWLSGGALAIALTMIIGLLALVLVQGSATFWPVPLVQVRTAGGATLLGEVTRDETYKPENQAFNALPAHLREQAKADIDAADGIARRRLLRTGNFDLTGKHHTWVSDFEIVEETNPEWTIVIERNGWGNFYGTPVAFLIGGKVVATGPVDAWAQFEEHIGPVRDRVEKRFQLERHDMGVVNRKQNTARLDVARSALRHGKDSPEHVAAKEREAEILRVTTEEKERIHKEIQALDSENERFHMKVVTADGVEKTLPLATIVRAYPANQLDFGSKMGVYFSRWGEFLNDRPRQANTEGGVFPAIWGTVSMTLLMSLAVVPFGVLAALYLREYAKSGPIISAVRIAINNLAGVPSIVFGVFGVGFFCYLVGAYIDGGPRKVNIDPWPAGTWWIIFASAVLLGVIAFFIGIGSVRANDPTSLTARLLGRGSLVLWVITVVVIFALFVKTPFFSGFYEESLPNPTFGKGGMLWASLTLALLTLPVVIVATEEALAAVPNSMREGSYACGASKWQTIRRIVLPRAMPGIMTGMILAMARGAGEVAPLMLVGAVKLTHDLPIDFFDWTGELGPLPTGPIHANRSFMHLGYHIFDVGFQSPNSEAARPMVYTTTLLLILIVALLNVLAIWLRSRLRRRFQVSQF